MKVLIADNEINIILLIKSLISHKKTVVETIGEAGDDITTLEVVCWLKPDVVIIDIRMPGMSGMDLIRHVREEQISVEFVIISGYSESEYVRSAIQYGVSDYLLKSIKKDELNDVLAELESQRVGRREQQVQLNLMEDRLASNNGILCKSLLQNFLTGDGKLFGQALEAGKGKDIFDFRGSCFTVAAVKPDCMSDSEYQVSEQAVETIIVEIMRKLKACCREMEFIVGRSWGCICLNYGGGESALDHTCSELGEMLKRTEYKDGPFKMTMGIGSQVSSLEYLPDSLDTAVKSVMLRTDLGVGSTIRHDRLPENYKKDSCPLPKEFEVKMERQVPLLVPGRPVPIGEEAMNRAVEGWYRYYRLYGLLEEMLERAGFVFSDIAKDYEVPDTEPYIRHLENCTTSSQPKQVRADYVSMSCELCQRQKDDMGSRLVRMIKEYIGEHYNENITLSDIADIMFLNLVYLSAMFKEETGQTLTQYLIDARIDKIKEMLRNPERSIGETVCLAGYQDERHFGKLSSKMTGVKPTEYYRFYV